MNLTECSSNKLYEISLITSLYRSANFIQAFLEQSIDALQELGVSFEIILVNDGSPDNSLEIANTILTQRKVNFKLIDLSRNFGHHEAFLCGLHYVEGSYAFLIDSDLEENPALVKDFYSKIKNYTDYDVVYGAQNTRAGGAIEQISGSIFYSLFNFLSDIKIPKNPATIRIFSRRYVEAIKMYKERRLFLAGIYNHAGFKQLELPIEKTKRIGTSYSLTRKISLLLNSITGFSSKPLFAMAGIGCAVLLFAMTLATVYIYRYFVIGAPAQGWTSLLVLNLFFFGLTFLFLGLVGIYIGRLFEEVKHRPRYIVRNVSSNQQRQI